MTYIVDQQQPFGYPAFQTILRQYFTRFLLI